MQYRRPQTDKPIVLLALNARWTHTSFGIRCLIANLGELQPRARLLELSTNEQALEVVEQILACDPALVGIGVYIWNVDRCTEVVQLLKRLHPDLPVILGGPEVSFADDAPGIVELADWVVAGEGEIAFRELCLDLLSGRRPTAKYLHAGPPDLGELELPYDLYQDEDIGRRTIYLEASRGCPFRCELCLSGLEGQVRRVPRERLLAAMERLWRRGVRHYKLVDRTLHMAIEPDALLFFLERWEPGTFLHMELVPDHLPQQLAELLARFPAGSIQVEAGIQTFDQQVAERIGRRQNQERSEATLRFLRHQTGVHIHADLVVGLPGETMRSFAAGFNRLLALEPHEIQVGLLKRLRGTALPRHDRQWGMVYSPLAPYEILQTSTIDFTTMRRLRRFARCLDLVYNSGSFTTTAQLLLAGGSPFVQLLAFSDWLYQESGQIHSIALHRLARLLFRYLTGERCYPAERIRQVIDDDYQHCGRVPITLAADEPEERPRSDLRQQLPARQQRRVPNRLRQ